MSDLTRESFNNIIKNNEYNNISLRIINDKKQEHIKTIIDNTKRIKQNISIKIPFNPLKYTTVASTNPNNIRPNKITVNKNMIMNKISSTNLKMRTKNLNDLKYYSSSTNIQKPKDNLQKNHVIYISKRKDSSMSNNEKNQNEINKYNNYSSQTMTVTKLSRNNINQTKDLYKQIIIPQKRHSSIVNSISDINQNNNINIYTNYTNNSNTFRNVNIKTTALKNYNYLTHNVRKNKIDNETKQRNNKMFFNNTLTTVKEIKNDNLISHKINRKDLENLKNKNTVNVYNSSKGEKFFINPRKHNSFISEIPKNPYARYGSKDSIFEKINISKNTNIITITNINNNSNNQNANNLIKIPHSFNKNIIYNNSNNNITKISQNTIYPENEVKNKINVNIINSINNKTLKNLGDRNNWKNTNSILHKTNIRDIINKSMDNKEIKTPKIDNKNIVFIRKEFSLKYKNKERENKEYINEKIKEEKEEDSSNKSIKEEDEIKQEKKQKKKRKLKQEDDNGNKILFINRRLVSDISNHSSNKDIISNVKTEIGQKKHKEPLDSIRKVKGKKIQKKLLVHKKHQKKEELNNIKIENINNNNENKNENTETKSIDIITEVKNKKPQISERIKHLLINNKIKTIKPATNISFTDKKNFKNYFNTETSDTKDTNDDFESRLTKKLKRFNLKVLNQHRLINSFSVKNNLRKYISDRKKFFNTNLKKYQYNDDDEESINKDRTKTAKKLNNYTYLELKDIKNSKRDTFITLHSIGGGYNDSRFDDMEPSSLTHMDLGFKEFKPYTALHPNKKFKKRGLANFRMNSERKISGIKIVGNTDSIEYQYDKFNFRTLKKDSILGQSMRNIHLKTIDEKKWFKRDDSSKSFN